MWSQHTAFGGADSRLKPVPRWRALTGELTYYSYGLAGLQGRKSTWLRPRQIRIWIKRNTLGNLSHHAEKVKLSLGRQHGRVWEKPTTTGSKLQSLGRTVSLLYALKAERLQIGFGFNPNKQQWCTDTYTNNVEGKRWSAPVYQLAYSWLCPSIGSHTSSSCVQLITGCPAASRRPLTLKGTPVEPECCSPAQSRFDHVRR